MASSGFRKFHPSCVKANDANTTSSVAQGGAALDAYVQKDPRFALGAREPPSATPAWQTRVPEKLTFLPRPNFSLVCEWVTKRPAHPLCERSHYGPIPRPVESPAWERRGRRTVAFSPLSRNPRALPELSPRGSGLPALVPGRRPGADPGPTGCAGVHPLRSPATFLTCLRSPR